MKDQLVLGKMVSMFSDYEVERTHNLQAVKISLPHPLMEQTVARHGVVRALDQYEVWRKTPLMVCFRAARPPIASPARVLLLGYRGDVIEQETFPAGRSPERQSEIWNCLAYGCLDAIQFSSDSSDHLSTETQPSEFPRDARFRLNVLEPILVEKHHGTTLKRRSFVDQLECEFMGYEDELAEVRFNDWKRNWSETLYFDRGDMPAEDLKRGSRLIYVIEKVGKEITGRFSKAPLPRVSKANRERIAKEVKEFLGENDQHTVTD